MKIGISIEHFQELVAIQHGEQGIAKLDAFFKDDRAAEYIKDNYILRPAELQDELFPPALDSNVIAKMGFNS
jgi:hypothetical protein